MHYVYYIKLVEWNVQQLIGVDTKNGHPSVCGCKDEKIKSQTKKLIIIITVRFLMTYGPPNRGAEAGKRTRTNYYLSINYAASRYVNEVGIRRNYLYVRGNIKRATQ